MLQTVLNNLSQGVLMFDSETRLIFCNHRYVEMYGLLPDAARTGRLLRDLLTYRIQTGTFCGDPDDYIVRLREGIATGEIFTHVVTLADGRTFSVVSKPMPGGGWLATLRTSPSGNARSSRSPIWRTTTR